MDALDPAGAVEVPVHVRGRRDAHRGAVPVAPVGPWVCAVDPAPEESSVAAARVSAAPILEGFGGGEVVEWDVGDRRWDQIARKHGYVNIEGAIGAGSLFDKTRGYRFVRAVTLRSFLVMEPENPVPDRGWHRRCMNPTSPMATSVHHERSIPLRISGIQR